MKAPYVGITGFKTSHEVRGILDKWDHSQFHDYRLMLGFLCSTKRLNNLNERGKASPAAEDLAMLTGEAHKKTMLVDLPRLSKGLSEIILPMIHYYPQNREELADEVARVFHMNGMYEDCSCRALQINATWPDIRQVEKIKESFPEMEILLSVTSRAIGQELITDIAKRTGDYKGLIDYVLVDPSGGKGVDFSVARCSDIMVAIRKTLPDVRMGIAGGLDGENVIEKFLNVTRRVKEPFCIDAEGKLRTEVFGESFLAPEKVHSYLKGARHAIAFAHQYDFGKKS